MKITRAVLSALALLLSSSAFAQNGSTDTSTPAVWSVPVGLFSTKIQPAQYPKAVFTPMTPVTVRRVEALSELGPRLYTGLNLDLKPCPVEFSLELSNGTVRQLVPISNKFIAKDSGQTYTDSGPLNVVFPAGSPITLSIVVPPAKFPATPCTCSGLTVSVQYSGSADH